MDSEVISLRETVAPESVVRLDFTSEQAAGFREEADRRHAAMSRSKLSYGETTTQRQFVGVLGEAAVVLWLLKRLPQPEIWLGPKGYPDVYVRLPDNQGLTLIEVKAHQSDFWRAHGRTMKPQQLARISADLVAWCVVPRPLGSGAYVVGWSALQHIRDSATPEPEHWLGVRVNARLCAPDELTNWLVSGRREPLPGSAG